ncbi:MAG TPA: KpsF/GutQ family sugar-phosphate isomerase [Cyanobacteria bacterium UBA11991]|nr:KpsF/GutQ family sugar-phosphate isomerase [Cyanobacteriota bacterium]MDY6363654.1 KpsF/GutQ family sugar-phosphate isomerase [Cyanobacteriota bacterium]MDY6382588.1 KpsF/GutQ family sugar-phosphate isomerase [Cyanobacteriota bacterium]HCB10918.1 KpsF/GutQ family sugar-phosphate isomerase [Cyanobacteria bacterium UBA11991]
MNTVTEKNNDFSIQEKADIKSAANTINSEIETICQLRDGLDQTLTQALNLMQQAKGRIIVTGMGKSGHIARKIAASLASTGTPSFFVHPAEASHGDLGMITEDDVVIAISNSGESKELVDILNYCKRFGIPLIAITKNPQSSLGKAGDIVLKLPDNGEACPLGLAPTNSTTATLVLGDVLTTCMIERKGFTKADFNDRHPGGKLGSILQRVSDLMHTGEEMPLLEEHAGMQSVLLEMTSKRLGCVGFVNSNGDLTGILTDGDLRRCLTPDVLEKTAIELMTKNPKTVTKDTIASEAMKIMHDKKITNLFVIEDKKPIGVIHIHDLLNHGVV